MKKAIKIAVALTLILALSMAFTACGDSKDQKDDSKATEAVTEKATEAPTEAPTEPPTEAPTEKPENAYNVCGGMIELVDASEDIGDVQIEDPKGKWVVLTFNALGTDIVMDDFQRYASEGKMTFAGAESYAATGEFEVKGNKFYLKTGYVYFDIDKDVDIASAELTVTED